MNAQDSGSETHVYTAEGSRADTPAAVAAAAADFRVQLADLFNRCDADDPGLESVPRRGRWNRSSDPENARNYAKDVMRARRPYATFASAWTPRDPLGIRRT